MEKQVVNLAVFLIKDSIDDFWDCLKNRADMELVPIKETFRVEGVIGYCSTSKKQPKWKAYLEKYASEEIDIQDNTSNKAVMLIRVKERIMVVTFGYGRSLLREEVIERNFGLKVSLNLIDPNKMRSVNATTIEDMVVITQRQASYHTSQEEFGLSTTNDIMRGITGEIYDDEYGNHISGRDALMVSVRMDLEELFDKLELYYDAYTDERYKRIGFEWIDNVAEVRDKELCNALDQGIVRAVQEGFISTINISPSEIINWDRIHGFCFSGIGLNLSAEDNYSIDIRKDEYLNKIRNKGGIIKKLKNDKLYAIYADGASIALDSVYNCITNQTDYEGTQYIICAGVWYKIESSFYEYVNNFVINQIPIANINLPNHKKNKSENEYNTEAVSLNSDFCLLDCKLVAVEEGKKQVEACDIFTRSKQFVHVKKRGHSAQLSHLFSQGKVSAQCFASDGQFRKEISDRVSSCFGEVVFDPFIDPVLSEYEVVFAILKEHSSDSISTLPFFSKVNLMMSFKEIRRMRYNCSVVFVDKYEE